VSNKLKSALDNNQNEDETEPIEKVKNVLTTTEELEGFYIVKSIVGEHVDLKRIFYRDNQSYFTILLDDKNYKWFTRLYFNGTQKYVSVNQRERAKIYNF
jgi:predicted type IV restriction endonuclease